MKIVISFNQSYWPLADALLKSLSKNSSIATEVIVLTDCQKTIRQYVDHLEKKYEYLNNLSIRIEDVSEKLLPFNSFGRFPKIAFARLFIDHYCSGRVLYLDVDTLVLSDLKSLYNWNIDKYGIAAVEDFGMRLKLRSKTKVNKCDYFNAGVMLLDCSKSNVRVLLENARNFATSNSYQYGDQDALNEVLGKNYHKLPLMFNNYAFLGKNIKIVHFAHIKPWQKSRFVLPYGGYYCFSDNNSGERSNVSMKKVTFIILMQIYIRLLKSYVLE